MNSDILSIFALAISGLTAIFAALIPAIFSYKAKKAELALKREIEFERLNRATQHEQEAKFEKFYQSHLKILTDFSELYFLWNTSKAVSDQEKLIGFSNNLSILFQGNVQTALLKFVEKIKNNAAGDNLDDDFKTCLRLILNSYGVKISERCPDIILPDLLKNALKQQFSKLNKVHTDIFNAYTV